VWRRVLAGPSPRAWHAPDRTQSLTRSV